MNTSQPYDVAFSVHAGRDMREIRRYLTKNASTRIALKVKYIREIKWSCYLRPP